eukprot:TRINITY_DN2843_c0_g1_i2.p1 TRINITY_DN2843_c0_g1~~TRINITY_DN2843_c0_g1_i2.p1  ORF type:complete len:154 (+),score=43.31 TRINITY_DN2843_c0_g1_i2:49-510(+)
MMCCLSVFVCVSYWLLLVKYNIHVVFFFFFKQKTAYEMLRSLVGSEMCIRDSSMLVSGDKCLSCPPGASCPSVGMPSTVPCSPGTYQPNAGSTTCLPCEEGWACTNTGQVSSYVTACAQGHFCPRGTASTASFPCPAGSYTYRTDLALSLIHI